MDPNLPVPMLAQSILKYCLACNKPLRGRTDKKFCDDHCRNSFNNQLKAGSNNCIRNINNALRKNRRILEGLLVGGETTVKASRDKLLQQGFLFSYHTHTYTNRRGNRYHFCYEYGWLELENSLYLVVRREEGE